LEAGGVVRCRVLRSVCCKKRFRKKIIKKMRNRLI